jgi:hypothetical protein
MEKSRNKIFWHYLDQNEKYLYEWYWYLAILIVVNYGMYLIYECIAGNVT